MFVFPWHNYGLNVPYTGKDYRLGLDLQWGIELDYKVDLEEVKKEEDYSNAKEQQIIEWLKSIIDKRVQTLNINDSVITSASYGWDQHIIVQIPLKGNDSFENKENIKKAKDAIGKVVKIEFKELRTEITEEDKAERKTIAEAILKEVQNSAYDFSVAADKAELVYENIEVGSSALVSEIYGLTDETPKSNEIIETEWGFLILSELKEDKYEYIFINKSPSAWKPAADSKGRILNDKYFVNSSVQFNQAYQPMVELVFNDDGAEIFGELTTKLVGQQIAIFVGGELLTAPNVNEPILSGKAVITGQYTPEEAKKLSTNINTGVVPAPIFLTSEKTIDSKLGAKSLEKLIVAGIAGFVIIFFFLIAIYRAAGVMASISLFLYVMLVLSIIKALGIVLTLASIAGLILSIGMAIDANILIFERIKVELGKGHKMKEAAKTGFKKSWSAIWDSNVTGFIVAMILFIFGINLIKWFGLMLALWIMVSLFTAMYVSRVLVIFLADTFTDKWLFIGFKK